MFSQACVILFRIGLMATRSLLIFVMGRSLRILLECFLVTACKLSLGQGNVFTGECQLFCSGGESLYDVTSCLADWSHVPSGGSLSLVPCSFQGVGVSVQGVSVREGRAVRILLEFAFLLSLIPSILCGILAVSFIELGFHSPQSRIHVVSPLV